MINSMQFCSAVIAGAGAGSAPQANVPLDPWGAPADTQNQELFACILGMLGAVNVEDIVPVAGHVIPRESWIKPQLNFLKRMDGFGPHAKAVLGSTAESRLQEFKKYERGWDFGRGEPLSSICIALVDSFVNKYSKFGSTPPSLFLTREGNLQLNWEDKAGLPLEVEFYPGRFEYYIGRNEEEGAIDIDQENLIETLELLIKKIS